MTRWKQQFSKSVIIWLSWCCRFQKVKFLPWHVPQEDVGLQCWCFPRFELDTCLELVRNIVIIWSSDSYCLIHVFIILRINRIALTTTQSAKVISIFSTVLKLSDVGRFVSAAWHVRDVFSHYLQEEQPKSYGFPVAGPPSMISYEHIGLSEWRNGNISACHL